MASDGLDSNPAAIASIVASVLPLLFGNTTYLGNTGFLQGVAAGTGNPGTSNLLSNFIYGSNWNPSHGITNLATYFLSNSTFGQMFGMTNPNYMANMATNIASNLYSGPGAISQGQAQFNGLGVLDFLNTYQSYKKGLGAKNVFGLSAEQDADIINMLALRREITEDQIDTIRTGGKLDADFLKKKERADSAYVAATKFLGMQGSATDIMNMASALAGTNDFEQATQKFTDFIMDMVEAGVDMADRMKVVKDTLDMQTSLRAKGFGAALASDISMNTVLGAKKAAAEERKRGNKDFDAAGAANANAAMQAEWLTTTEGTQAMAYVGVADEISDPNKRSAYLAAIKGAGSERERAAVAARFGLTDNVRAAAISARQDPMAFSRGLSADQTSILTQIGSEQTMGQLYQRSISSIDSNSALTSDQKARLKDIADRTMRGEAISDLDRRFWQQRSGTRNASFLDIAAANRAARENAKNEQNRVDRVTEATKSISASLSDIQYNTVDDDMMKKATRLSKDEVRAKLLATGATEAQVDEALAKYEKYSQKDKDGKSTFGKAGVDTTYLKLNEKEGLAYNAKTGQWYKMSEEDKKKIEEQKKRSIEDQAKTFMQKIIEFIEKLSKTLGLDGKSNDSSNPNDSNKSFDADSGTYLI